MNSEKLKIVVAVIFALAAIEAFYPALRAQEQASPLHSVWDGVYTEEQAGRGEKLYNQECAICHFAEGIGGEVATALTGPAFLANWDGLTVGDLSERIRVSMPPAKPGQLSRRQIADILGHMLKANGFPAGKNELTRDTEVLKQIRIDTNKPKDRSE